MIQFFKAYQTLFLGLSLFSVFLFFASLAAVPWLIARIPADYFLTLGSERITKRVSTGSVSARLLRNILGGIVFVMGVIMLFIPGQGILTMIAGLVLMQFPGKQAAVLYLVRHKKVQNGLNWIREKKSRSPLDFPE